MHIVNGVLAFFAIVSVMLSQGVDGLGCGQPSNNPEAVCTDWQCSRRITLDEVSNNLTYCVRGLGRGESPCTTDADCYRQLVCNHSSTQCVPTGTLKNPAVGFLGVGIAVALFGTNYIPARRLRSGNGVFFQFAMSIGILVVGIVVQLVRGSSTIYPASMIGGMLWAIGNCASIRAINSIGIGLSVTAWGCSSMLVGWAGGRFGVWGMQEEVPSSEVLNILGVVTGVVAIVVFGFVKPAEGGNPKTSIDSEEESAARLLNSDAHTVAPLSPSKRIAGFCIALGCGVCYGFNFDPSQAMMDNYAQRTIEGNTRYSPNGLDYALSEFLGIFMTAVAYYTVVLLLRSRFPSLDDPADTTPAAEMFPLAFVSGAMWAGATAAWFVANTNLGLVVSYPLIALGPCVVASVIGGVFFGELRGRRNMLLLLFAFATVAASCAFTVRSRE